MKPSLIGSFLLLGLATLSSAGENGETAAQLVGHLADINVSYSVAQSAPEMVTVEILLPSGRSIRAEIDSGTQTVSVRSLAQRDGPLAPLSATDHDILLRVTLPSDEPAAEAGLVDALMRTVNFISSYPPDVAIDFSSLERAAAPRPKRIASLCGSTGKQATGTYTVHGKTFTETVKVGPCYNAQNECLGRCGPGCGAPPSPTIQIFTQDCLNHDLCTRATGTILGECKDEWLAAGDDFFFGKDCGSLTAGWTDSYHFHWQLQQSAVVRGSMHSSRCPDSSVTGKHTAANLTLTAKLRSQQQDCCPAFTYIGSFKDCNNAAGTWTNVCGLSGQWTMSRDSSKSLLVLMDDDSDSPSAGAADPSSSSDPP